MDNSTYPYSSAIILDDSIYEQYGGYLDTTVPALRQNAYWIAERTLSDSLQTFLLPTIVTGTYFYNPTRGSIILDHTYVHSVNVVRFIDTDEEVYWAVTGTDNVYVSLRQGELGLLDVHYLISNCDGCHDVLPYPYQIQVMYTAGLPTGTANNPDLLLVLSQYSKVLINELIGFGNESTGDIGVQNFSDQQYQETRAKLLRTDFGTSAIAQFINRFVNKYRRHRYVGL